VSCTLSSAWYLLLSAGVSVFLLAIPILAGPWAIASVVLSMSLARTNIVKIGAVLVSVAPFLTAVYVAMRLGDFVVRRLGETGIHVIGRGMGILLAALAVQFVLNGLAPYLHRVF